MKLFQAAALLLSAHSVVAGWTSGIDVVDAGRQLVGASCDAVTSCDSPQQVCNEVNGHKYWSISLMTSKNCLTRCVDGRDLAFMKSIGYNCGPCPEAKCEAVHQCKDGFSMFSIECNGKCKDECVKANDVENKLRDKKPWKCGLCAQPVEVTTRTGGKIDCSHYHPGDTLAPPACLEKPPTPDSCLLKRALKIQRYSPNWVNEEAGVYIEIQVMSTKNIYKFGDVAGAVAPIPNKTVAEFPIGNDKIFLEMKDGGSIQMRFVSPRGAGGWSTCKYSPIAIDLDNSGGVERLTGLQFDMDITGDGELETLHEWFGPKEGILVFLGRKLTNADLESSIAITGQELMGDMGGQYTDGFDKLADYDKDNNNLVEGSELRGFYLWIDVNSNYKLDAGELHDLEDYNIVSISTQHNGSYKSSAFKKDGTEMLIEDLWFSRR